MGYTHYWTVKNTRTKNLDKKYLTAIKKCQQLVREYSENVGGLSGYTAHTKPGQYGGLKFNGSRENGHEDFVMRETLPQQADVGFQFCKTAQKPYDILVVACLIILKHYLGAAIEVQSDGDSIDLGPGLMLAKKVVPKCTMPQSIRRPIKPVRIA